jgi:hypothetical protein
MKKTANITIDNLNIKMPSGFGRRANPIARAAARQLSQLPVRHSLRLAKMAIPNVVLQGGETDTVIASRIARAIHRQINISHRKGTRHVD